MDKRLLFCILLMMLVCLDVQAQRKFRKPLKSTNNQAILGFSNYNVGMKVGCPWSVMIDSDLQETTYEGHFGYLAGFFVERSINRWSIAAEVDFAQKGTKMHNEREYQISLGQIGKLKTIYSVAYNVISLRFPVTYYFKGIMDGKVVPYVFAGPQVDLPMKFNLNLNDFSIDSIVMAHLEKFDGPKGEDPYSNDPINFNPVLNVSAFAGLGLMSKIRFANSAIIFKLDAGVNYGILNLAKPEAKKRGGSIHAHDLEVNFSVVYPIKKILHDACYIN